MSGNFSTVSCCLETDMDSALHIFCNFTLYLKTIQNLTMQNNLNSIRLTFVIFLLFVAKATIFAAEQDISAVKAMQLFDGGNFAEAEKMFRMLLDEDPRNPMLNYYYGASRTETGNFEDSDLNHLLQAGKDVTPDRLNYYLGIQYHARNNWEQALKFYNQFRLSVPENEQQQLELAGKIQQCFNQENPFSNMITHQPEPEKTEVEQTKSDLPQISNQTTVDSALQQTNIQAIEKHIEPEIIFTKNTQNENQQSSLNKTTDEFKIDRKALPDLPGVKPTYDLPKGEQIEFQVNNQVTYLFTSQFKTSEGKDFFEQGQELKQSLEHNLKEASKLREAYRNEKNPEIKTQLGTKILAIENDSYTLQDEINQIFTAARNAENQFWSSAGSVAIYNFQVENEKIKSVLNSESQQQNATPPELDSIIILPLINSEIYDAQSTGSTSDKLVYKIQIGAHSRGVPAYRQRLYNKLSLIRKIDNYTDEKGVVVYTTGNLTNFEDAEKMRNQVRQEGIEDAVVVPYFNGKRITLEQAKKIEAGDDI